MSPKSVAHSHPSAGLRFLLPLVIIILGSADTLVAQRGQRVDIAAKRIRSGRQTIQLGEPGEAALKKIRGRVTRQGPQKLRHSQGITLSLDRRGRISEIDLVAPWGGKTSANIGIGTPAQEVQRAYPGFGKVGTGWFKVPLGSFLIAGGVVRAIKIDGKAAARRETGRPGTPIRPGRPGTPARPVVNPPVRPPSNSPTRPVTPTRPRRPQLTSPTLIWDETFRARSRARWVDAPTRQWPIREGRLLVRVFFPRSVTCEQLLAGKTRLPTKSEDYETPVNVVEQFARQHQGSVSWQWSARGRGRCRVQIWWFPSERSLKRYIRRESRRDYERDTIGVQQTYRPADYPQAARRVLPLWNHHGSDRRWHSLHQRNWPTDEGALVLRVQGRRSAGAQWRINDGPATSVGIGDHLLPADVVIRPAGHIFGAPQRGALRVRADGRGPVRMSLLWLPYREMAQRYCSEHPLAPVRPSWLFNPNPTWVQTTNFSQDWRGWRPQIPSGCINGAARRRGGTVIRSCRDSNRSEGSEFDGGMWYSANERSAWTESWFVDPISVRKITIATAGGQRGAADYLMVELRGLDGRWRRVAALHEHNVNWRGQGGHRSRPWLEVPCDGSSATAIRISLTGQGPFRVGGVSVLGIPDQRHGLLEIPQQQTQPHTRVSVDATRGWVNCGAQIQPGQELLFAVSGEWRIGARTRGYPACGPEGLRPNLLDPILGQAQCRQFVNSLPVPGAWPGSLIARIGLHGAPFIVPLGEPLVVSQGGPLFLACNDRDYNQNTGVMDVVILGLGAPLGPLVPVNPPIAQRPATVVRAQGRLVGDRDGRPLAGVDVVLQLESWPRTIFGGARTSSDGRFSFESEVPDGVGVVLRAPEYRLECLPRRFSQSGAFPWDVRVR